MPETSVLELAKACARAAEECKAENVCIYDLRDVSSLTDYAVVCTSLSVPHIRSIVKDVEHLVCEATEVDPVYKENRAASLWAVLDYIDVMVHVMGEEAREFYGLDALWEKAPKVAF